MTATTVVTVTMLDKAIPTSVSNFGGSDSSSASLPIVIESTSPRPSGEPDEVSTATNTAVCLAFIVGLVFVTML